MHRSFTAKVLIDFLSKSCVKDIYRNQHRLGFYTGVPEYHCVTCPDTAEDTAFSTKNDDDKGIDATVTFNEGLRDIETSIIINLAALLGRLLAEPT